MNKIRVCAFLALVVFIGSVVTDMFSGFMDGWNEAGDQKDFHALPSVSLLVRADDTLPADTLISAAQDTPMYCNTSEVNKADKMKRNGLPTVPIPIFIRIFNNYNRYLL